MKYYHRYKVLSPTVILILALIYMLVIGNRDTDRTIWRSMDAHAQEDYFCSIGKECLEFDLVPPVTVEPWTIFNLDKWADAVARFETGSCTLGYGAMYNNCFGIKNGNTAPCPKIGKNRMCIYERPEDSYEAFKKIWTKLYGLELPTLKKASKWSGNHNAYSWHKTTREFYLN
jgi:hypothetical protein